MQNNPSTRSMTAGRPIRSSVSLIPRNPGGRKSPMWRASSRRQSNANGANCIRGDEAFNRAGIGSVHEEQTENDTKALDILAEHAGRTAARRHEHIYLI